jgi:hypothetical protein
MERFCEPQPSLTGGAHHNDPLTGGTEWLGSHLHRHFPKLNRVLAWDPDARHLSSNSPALDLLDLPRATASHPDPRRSSPPLAPRLTLAAWS